MAGAIRRILGWRLAGLIVLVTATAWAGGAWAAGEIDSRSKLANRCVSVESGDSTLPGAERLYLKPTSLRTYLIRDREGKLLAPGDEGEIERIDAPGPPAEWRIKGRRGSFTIRSTSTGAALAEGKLGLVAAKGCSRFPEAQVGARGPFDPTKHDRHRSRLRRRPPARHRRTCEPAER